MSKKSRRRHFEYQYTAGVGLEHIGVDDLESPEITIDEKAPNWQDVSNPRNGFCVQRRAKHPRSEYWGNSRFSDWPESDYWDIWYLQ